MSLLLITCAGIIQSHFEIILFITGYFKVTSRWQITSHIGILSLL